MQVQEQLDLSLLLAPRHQPLEGTDLWLEVGPGAAELAIEVLAEDASAVVADEDSVRVEHR